MNTSSPDESTATSFDSETAIERHGEGHYTTWVTSNWNIGMRPNGGYLMSTLLRALLDTSGAGAAWSLTTHFLRPANGDEDAEIQTHAIRQGRRLGRYQGTMSQQGKPIATMIAGLTAEPVDTAADNADESERKVPSLTIEAPDLPDPASCVRRSGLEQGVNLPINSRLDVRLPASQAMAGTSGEAEISGWIRFRDGREPDRLCLPLFSDAFPPSLFAMFGYVGWVPTVEMTVHVRRTPAPGWIRGRFVCHDIADGYMVEDGSLWDSEGELVAQSRQIGLVQLQSDRADAQR